MYLQSYIALPIRGVGCLLQTATATDSQHNIFQHAEGSFISQNKIISTFVSKGQF